MKYAHEELPCRKVFNIGDHVGWNSEAGRVSGVVVKKITSDAKLKGYIRHASKESPQYVIKSDKSDHMAIHKGTALQLVRTPKKKSGPKTNRISQLSHDLEPRRRHP
jgi:hypothetical protein